MARVTLVQMVYNAKKYIPLSVASMVNQTYKDIEVVCVINGNEDGSKEYIAQHFPKVTIIDPGENLKFVRGHNLVFEKFTNTEFFQLVNDDLWLEPNYVEEMLKVFEDTSVAAANGKIFNYNYTLNQKTKVLDTTGIEYSKSGGGRSRGQHQEDLGQFDNKRELIASDGSSSMYRRSALEEVKYQRADGSYEYYDVDFEMYWEDVDLSLRMINAGYSCRFVPSAVGYHGRTAAASPGGYKKVFAFIKHHRSIAPWIRKGNYKNHIFLFIKNSPKWYPQFFVREFFYQVFVLLIETSTLKVLPTFLKQLPLMWKKRKYIQKHRKISVEQFEKLLS
ncbi:MAG: glycosyltransferase family 2 protein [Candidatus Doudnabacteria bacterium]|nr:glycosyltransferase family 2 protein [Candidatus Doudnabacteria bacterium]